MPRISDLPLTSSVDEATSFIAVAVGGTTYKISLQNAILTADGISFFDSDNSHLITLKGGSNLSANRDFTISTGDANRTLDISAGNTTISAFAITFLDDANASAVRTTLGLGTMATETASNYLTTAAAASGYQPLDGDLTALAALSGTNTIYYRSAANTWSAVAIGANLTFSGGSLSAAGGITDGDYGDIVVSGSGTALNIDSAVATAFGRSLMDDADATAGRATLGLGTAATQNTGTSGATIPFLNGSNTWGSQQIIEWTASPFGNGLVVQATEDSAGSGPGVLVRRISASPAALDQIGFFQFQGRDSAANNQIYASLSAEIVDPTSGSEDGGFSFNTVQAGAVTASMGVRLGAFVGSPTGGDQGVGTLNAVTLHENGTSLASKYGQLAVANTWTAVQTVTVSASFATALQLESTNADNIAGPILNLYRNSASPAAADVGGMIQWRGNNATPTNTIMGQFICYWRDVTPAAEFASIAYNVRLSGVNTAAMEISNGVIIGSPTGFWQGTGTLNAVTLYENGSALTAKYGQLAVGNTWTASQSISGSSSFFTALTAQSTNADANAGPYIILLRTGGTPAASDLMGTLLFQGQDSALATRNHAAITAVLTDPTAGSDDVNLRFATIIAGASATRAYVGDGFVVGAPSGGDLGGGTINAGTLHEGGTALSAKYGQLTASNTWTNTNSCSSTWTFTTAGSFGIPGQFISTNADANAGPYLYLYRNSASAAVSDLGPTVSLRMNDSAGTAVNTAEFYATLTAVTPGAVSASLVFTTSQAGSTSPRLTLAAGAVIGSATGGDQGAGTLNANTLYEAGTSLAAKYQPLDGDLTSLAAASGTNTIYYRSAANTWSPVTIGVNLTFSAGTLAATGGATLGDGDYGDIVVSSSGTVLSIDTAVATTFGRSLMDDADAAAGRTTLGLGTAATQNTGTSGATIPLLNANNTWSGAQTITQSGSFGTPLTLIGTNDDGNESPNLTLRRNSATPANGDRAGSIVFQANDSTPTNQTYAEITLYAQTVTAGLMDAIITFKSRVAGVYGDRFYLKGGLYSSGASGGDQGVNTINATTLYEAGTSLQAKYARLAAANTFTATLNDTNASGWQLTTGAASATVPTIVPNRASATTGIGAQASGNMSLIVGGAEIGRVSSTGLSLNGASDTLLTIDRASGTERAIGFMTSGALRWRFLASSTAESGSDSGSDLTLQKYSDAAVPSAAIFISRATGQVFFYNHVSDQTATGYQLRTGTPSSTAPSLVPNRGSTSTGFGANAAGDISMILAGVEKMRLENTTSTNWSYQRFAVLYAAAQFQIIASSGDGNGYFGAAAGSAASIRFSTGTAVGSLSERWLIGRDTAAESGSDAGSLLAIYYYTDAGAFKGTLLTASRVDGSINFRGGLFSNGVTGGNQGAGTANFTTLYEAGTSLASKYQPLDSDLTTIAGLVDPNADRILFWDDSAGAYAYLTLGTNLSITGTTINASGSGGGGTYGTATINFGSAPGTNMVTTTITGQAGILSGSYVSAWLMADTTASHNEIEHMIIPIRLTCGNIVAGVGFDIVAFTDLRLTGTFTCRWEGNF